MKTSNQTLRMYIIYKLYYDFMGYSWSFSTNSGTIFLDYTIIYQYCSSISYFIHLKKGKYKFHLGGG